MREISQAELDSVDPEIKDIVIDVNTLPFARTLFSCAGYGMVGGQGGKHLKSDTEQAYLVVQYDIKDTRWEQLHTGLSGLAAGMRSFAEYQVSYAFGDLRLRNVKRAWNRVRKLVNSVKLRCVPDDAAFAVRVGGIEEGREQVPEVRRPSSPRDQVDPSKR